MHQALFNLNVAARSLAGSCNFIFPYHTLFQFRFVNGLCHTGAVLVFRNSSTAIVTTLGVKCCYIYINVLWNCKFQDVSYFPVLSSKGSFFSSSKADISL